MKKFVSYIILIAYIISILPFQVFALTASDIREQMNNTNEQISNIDKEIKKLYSQIAQTAEEKNTLANAIKTLNLTRSKLLKEREQIEKQINITGLAIQTISSDIQTKEQIIQTSKKTLGKMIRDLNENDNMFFIEKLLSSTDFKDFSREYSNILSINEDIKNNIRLLLNKKVELTSTKEQKETEKNKLNGLKKDLVLKEQVVVATKKEKDSLLVATNNEEIKYQKMLAEQIKKRDAFEKDLATYENQLKFILNPSTLPKEGSEVLAWPLNYVLITQLFGVTSASKRLYTSGSHSGLDFRAAVGTSVKSVADGTVLGTGDTDIYCKGASFGKWVLIKHNNGLSTAYGHLSVISVKKGDKVKTGDIIALSGNTGHSTGPHLHLTVYASDGVKVDSVPSVSCSGKSFIMPIAASNSYLDPMLYLPKATASMYK